MGGVANDTDHRSSHLHAFLLPRASAPESIRKCSDNPPSPCTVSFSQPPENTSTFRVWVQQTTKAQPLPPKKLLLSSSSSSPLPPFSRHRDGVSPLEPNSNQSLPTATRVDSVVGGNGGVMNVEDAFLNRSSVLFVAVSFILLMFISLAWLVFYYVQRFRYLHSKERASRRLAELARKAVARIPLKLLQAGDKEIGINGEHCAICIEPYRPFDNIRILPCRQ
uniref:RING-type domain-containing protein n=1 Tax=Mesocestoides corti TaxID=53468 RepID=A0A5K3FEQ6_MESCO